MKDPKVSVLMPVYNDGHYLERAINSMLGQTLKEIELIIVDDGSSDDSWNIIDSCAKKDGRIIAKRKNKNSGIVDSLNLALGIARADYVARMDGDDWCPKNRLKLQHQYLEQHPEVSVLGTDLRYTDDEGRVIGSREYDTFDIDSAIKVRSPIAHGTIMARKDDVRSAGAYNKIFDGAEDYDLWIRMHMRGKRFAVLPKKLYDYRLHSNSTKAKRTKQQLRRTIQTKLHARKEYGFSLGFVGWMRLIAERALLLLPASMILGLHRMTEVRG